MPNPTQRATDAAVAARTRNQHGVISRQQARALGLSSRQIDRRQADRTWLRLLPETYVLAGISPGWMSWAWAALLAAGRDAALVASSAASLRGWSSQTWPITLAVPPERRLRWNSERVACLRLTVPSEDVVLIDGLPTTSRLRTAVDVAHLLPLAAAQEILDRMLVLGVVELGALTEAIASSRRQGSRQARALMRTAADLAASEAERLAHRVFTTAGLGGWQANVDVAAGGRHVTVDLAFVAARVAVEINGWAFHSSPEQRRRDERKIVDLQLAGWIVLSFGWYDLVSRPEWVVERVRTALAARLTPIVDTPPPSR